jgi:hypothetical protein
MESAPSLVLIANAWDEDADAFVARHADAGAILLAPRDLSRTGWQFRTDDPAAAAVVADERRFRLDDVGGVLMRLAAVTEDDLPHIHAEDQAFVAAELSAFLLALLTQANVPVVNRPTPQCLCGPAWSDARWRKAAAGLGLPVKPLQWRATHGGDPGVEEQALLTVAVVGDACFGAGGERLADGCRALAKRAEAEMLTVDFGGSAQSPLFLRARPHVDLGDPRIATAVLRRFGIPVQE